MNGRIGDFSVPFFFGIGGVAGAKCHVPLQHLAVVGQSPVKYFPVPELRMTGVARQHHRLVVGDDIGLQRRE